MHAIFARVRYGWISYIGVHELQHPDQHNCPDDY